jgi:hypothetical protein
MSTLRLRIFDGSRQPFPLPADFFVRVFDGNGRVILTKDFFVNVIDLNLSSQGGIADNYTINVVSKGFRSAGFANFVLKDTDNRPVDVMLIPRNPGFNFAHAQFADARARFPFIGPNDAATTDLYNNLLETNSPALACVLNISAAASQINLFGNTTPLNFLRSLRFDAARPPAPDRFFAWCDVALLQEIRNAAAVNPGLFQKEPHPEILHPGSTESWKESRFGEANVQFTFHGNDHPPSGDPNQVMIELDIDYFSNTVNHILLEVLPNSFGPVTDPLQVYVLRWIAGREYGLPDFDPLYTVVA